MKRAVAWMIQSFHLIWWNIAFVKLILKHIIFLRFCCEYFCHHTLSKAIRFCRLGLHTFFIVSSGLYGVRGWVSYFLYVARIEQTCLNLPRTRSHTGAIILIQQMALHRWISNWNKFVQMSDCLIRTEVNGISSSTAAHAQNTAIFCLSGSLQNEIYYLMFVSVLKMYNFLNLLSIAFGMICPDENYICHPLQTG